MISRMSSDLPTVLCVTRVYPPVVGGMERLSFEFTQALAEKTPTLIVANRHGKKALPLFLPWAAFQLRRLAPRADVIHLGDPLLTVLLPFLPQSSTKHGMRPPAADVPRGGVERPSGHGSAPEGRGERGRESQRSEPRWGEQAAISRDAAAKGGRIPIAVTLHGLDLLYPNPLYQALLRRFLPRVDLALCISRFVEAEARRRFPTLRTAVVTPGLAESFAVPGATRADLARARGRALPEGPLLLAVARLVPRKGLAWFVEAVLPRLPEATLLVIGDGPERLRITEAATRAGVASRFFLAGTVPRDVLALAYSTADLLVMPNLAVPGTAEGFGLVALEAASAGLPVVAADLEGIPDAIVPDVTGILLPPGDTAAWVSAMSDLLADPARRARLRAAAPRVVREQYNWDRRADAVLEAFRFSVTAPRP